MDLSIAKDYFKKPGTVGIMPTDTVYGIVALASDKKAVGRLYELKHRHKKPGTVIAGNIEQLVTLGLKRRYLKAVAEYWPGPLSVIIPCGQELSYLHLKTFGLAVRLPDNRELQNLIQEVGPLLTTSANQPGLETAKTTVEARHYFNTSVDFYIDGGRLEHKPSTIIKIVDDAIIVVRQGQYKVNLS